MADRITDFEVTYNLVDTTAETDASLATQDNQDFCDVTLLPQEGQEYDNFMTLEHNYAVLDGSLQELDSQVTVPFLSRELSDSEGNFDSTPTIEINFTELHSTVALTLNFKVDFPLQFNVSYFNGNTKIKRYYYNSTTSKYIAEARIRDYDKIVIEFTNTFPYRYVRLNHILFGQILLWTEDNLKSAKLVQSLDPLSDKLSIDTLTFEVIDLDHSMNFGNPDGLHNYFQYGQKFYPREYFNGDLIDLGEYFFKSSKHSDNVCTMELVSYVGLAEGVMYDRGSVYNGVEAGTILEDIFVVLGINNYNINEDIYNQLIYGTIAPCTCKEALQQILFACNGILDTKYRDRIEITIPNSTISDELKLNRNIQIQIEKEAYVSGVQLGYTEYNLNTEDVQEVINEDYEPGEYKVQLDSPYTDFTISGAEFIETSSYYLIFNVVQSGNVVVSAKGYDEKEGTVVSKVTRLSGGEIENIEEFSTTLCNRKTAQSLAKKLLDWHRFNLTLTIKQLAENYELNKRIIVDNPEGFNNYIGMYTQRNIALTEGFIDDAKLIAYFDTASNWLYTGTELYAGEGGII